jgi:hypothetical protein
MVDNEFTVEAKNKAEAKRRAMDQAKEASFDLSAAEVRIGIAKVT